MDLTSLPKDNIEEINDSFEIDLNIGNDISKKASKIKQNHYDKMKKKVYSKSCDLCVHKDMRHDYCNKQKQQIYDNHLYAFGCQYYKT